MATVIFVHGTSVRKKGYEATLAAISKGLGGALKAKVRHSTTVADCLWGDSHGVRLNAGGRSIPEYETSGGSGGPAQVDTDQALLWEMLAYDPLYELQGLALRPRKPVPMFDHAQFKNSVASLPSHGVAALIESAGIPPAVFQAACDYLAGHPVLDAALLASAARSECRLPAARAVIAVGASRVPGEPRPAAVTNPDLRRELQDKTADALGKPEMVAVVDWTKNLLYQGAKRMGDLALRADLWFHAAGGTPLVRWNRGKLSDDSAPVVGDILLYQARGCEIRDFIAKKVELAPPPVVLLGHSLGGIACVDLLIERHLPKVALLVTVGSQASLFYEINALPTLKYGQPLPGTFVKRWVNIYDPRDFLSYKLLDENKCVFEVDGNAPPSFADHEVDNRLKFPDAHGGYWSNKATWKIIATELAAL